MRRLTLALALIAVTASCGTATSRRVEPRLPTLAERTLQESEKDPDGLRKRPRGPRWIAPPPAYGNRVVQTPMRLPSPPDADVCIQGEDPLPATSLPAAGLAQPGGATDPEHPWG